MATATIPEITAINRAREVLAAAETLLATAEPGTITSKAREVIRDHARWLANSVEIHARLSLPPSDPEYLHPADEYPHLAEGWPDNALEQALALAVDDMETDTWVLAEVLREQAGDTGRLVPERSNEEGEMAA